MGTLSVKMKFSALVLASAVSAAPWGGDKDQSPVAISAGSGSAMSGSGSPKSGYGKSGHGYDKPNQDAMKEEYGEFKDMMAGVNQQNMVNVNFAPINNNNQNFVNVNTQWGMDVGINSKADKKDWDKDWDKNWDKHDKDEHYDDSEDHEIDWTSDKMEWMKKQFMAYFKGEIEAKVEAWKWEMHEKNRTLLPTYLPAHEEHDWQGL